MEDYRLEQQKNTAAQILLRAPLLNLYAYKNSLPPSIARFRLLQVISQSPDEADPTLASAAEQTPGGPQPASQAPGADQPQPEPQPAQQHAAAEPQQGPQPPRLAPDAIDGDPDNPRFSSGSSDSDSDSDSDSLSDLDEDLPVADGRAGGFRGARAAGAAAAEAAAVRRLELLAQVRRRAAQPNAEREQQRQQEQLQQEPQQQEEGEQQQQQRGVEVAAQGVFVRVRVREPGQRQAAAGEPQRFLGWAAADDEILPDAE